MKGETQLSGLHLRLKRFSLWESWQLRWAQNVENYKDFKQSNLALGVSFGSIGPIVCNGMFFLAGNAF